MKKIRVVLIENNDLTRLGLRTAFQLSKKIEVVGEAAYGTTGLDLLLSSAPDIAIVDIGLSDINGIEVTRRFKQSLSQSKIPSSSHTKIMVLTKQDDEETVLAALAAGADSYCLKYLSVDKLLQALYSTYEGKNWIDPAIARFVLNQSLRVQSPRDNYTSIGSNTVAIAADTELSRLTKLSPLTKRELEVLEMIVSGHSDAEIAKALHVTIGTVKTHVRNIMNKLCVDDRTQAAVRALRSGLVT